ncbi:hypothetical protein [Solirubrum puertoriconensis]|uniref:Lipoprotein n=1 Tax=Solirubrum puertoriconensis TaxID=1751427 RepID=A0A9X0HID5_SOLP1|nr:hypothetical protein [Solirubrum puertoriconensis]KUG06433.1 hypothetical protein ASU33_03495 [Solirubrum puertoriconensis]
MNTSSNLLRPFSYLGAALLLAAGLTACSTGTESGDTNVERGHEKIALDPGARHPSGGVDSTRMQRDTATSFRERQYQNARNRKDRNNDGIAD